MKKIFKTSGVCAREISLEVVDDIVTEVNFVGGCNGNAQGISTLVKGQHVAELIEKLENIKCGGKQTSCPAQLAIALKTF